ncbi:MAG: RNB domain-containing ribonuclease [Candidatus Eremiobacteraeota bacterium]|nr:RNB domain-containing ribonuclease [Candidatus Eremiobacteraeota bacterium]
MLVGAFTPTPSATHRATFASPAFAPRESFAPSAPALALIHPAGRNHRRNRLDGLSEKAMEDRGLQPNFSAQEMAEVPNRPAVDKDPAIRDLRALPWMACDNRGTSNAEQLTVAERLDNGAIRVRVAVSDVDACVPHGGALDSHARNNGKAAYTQGRNFPMFPWELLDQTSFQKNQERLAVVTEFVVDKDGAVESVDCYRAQVVNRGQLQYSQVEHWLNGTFPHHQTGAQMELQAEAADRLSRHREANELIGMSDGRRPAREMIEELMVTAGESSLDYLQSKGYPVLFQTIGKPARWDRLVTLAQRNHGNLPAEPSPDALKKYLGQAKARLSQEEYADLSISVEKILGRTHLAVKPAGQPFPQDYRLAEEQTTRATSPSRDYGALTVQRLLKAACAGQAPPDAKELEQLAGHLNRRVDDIAKVERQVFKCKDAMAMSSRVGQTFDASVTGAAEKGTWVRLAGMKVEGKLVQGNLNGLDIGDRVKVKLKHVDIEAGHVDFEVLKQR